MANLDITIKRKNGASYDVLHPTTIISQVTGLQTALDDKINTSARGAINGVASLGADGKVPVMQLPNAVFDSLYYQSTLVGITTLDELAYATWLVGEGSNRSTAGVYFVASAATTLTYNPGTATLIGGKYYRGMVRANEEGAEGGDAALEINDWIVARAILSGDGSTSANAILVEFDIVNNTYEAASSVVAGIVQLSDATTMNNLQNGVNHAITEDFLFDNKLADGSTLTSSTNLGKIAPAAHNHDGVYLGVGGNAVSASKWATARTITLGGDATGNVSIDGSANVTLNVEIANDSHTHAFNNITGKPTTLSGYGITDAQPLDGDLTSIAGLTGTTGLLRKTAANTFTLDTSTFLTGNQTITFSGDATGSGTTAVALTLANSGVTAGTYKSVTVNAKGIVTSGTNPTTLSGYGITDAYTQTAVNNLLLNRPEIYYNAAGDSDGDLVLDLDNTTPDF
jgi:hypothetical protein